MCAIYVCVRFAFPTDKVPACVTCRHLPPTFSIFLHIMIRVRRAGPAEATGKPILDLSFFRGGSDVDSSAIMLSKGQTDQRLHHFLPRCRFNAFLSHTTLFVNKMAVTHYEKAGVLRKIVKIHINAT